MQNNALLLFNTANCVDYSSRYTQIMLEVNILMVITKDERDLSHNLRLL